MPKIEALLSRLWELQEYKELIRQAQNRAFDLRLMDELVLMQKIFSDVSTRIEQLEIIIERRKKNQLD